jgi:hypothetical protein
MSMLLLGKLKKLKTIKFNCWLTFFLNSKLRDKLFGALDGMRPRRVAVLNR